MSIDEIQKACWEVFPSELKIKCAYLFGKYARGEAKDNHAIQLLIVIAQDMNYRNAVHYEKANLSSNLVFHEFEKQLEERLHKKVDLYNQGVVSDGFTEPSLEDLLIEGIKVY